MAGEPWRHKPALIAKIERSEAIPALEAILRASDGIMVARGDLAVEVGNAAVPALQKTHDQAWRASMDKVVITATQMMESMIVNPVPTRAEVSDVANAVLDGTDAVMLQRRDRRRQVPGGDRRDDGRICVEAESAEDMALDADFTNKQLRPHRPVDRDGRAVHRLPPGLQGHPGADRIGLDRAVDEPPQHPRAHLRPDLAAGQPAQDDALPQRAARC